MKTLLTTILICWGVAYAAPSFEVEPDNNVFRIISTPFCHGKLKLEFWAEGSTKRPPVLSWCEPPLIFYMALANDSIIYKRWTDPYFPQDNRDTLFL